MLIGHYTLSLVLVSIMVAILASYTALDLAGRIASAKGRAMMLWIGGGALSLGIGIWSMHFIGMLAFRLSIDLGFDVALTLLSLLVSVLSSGFALWLVSHRHVPLLHILLGALAMGFAIVGMHYTGMAAANFPEGSFCGAAADGLRTDGLDKLVLVTSLAVLTITLLTSVLDARLEARTAKLARSLSDANRELTQLALHDTLTGLPNRILLADRIEQAMRKVDSQGGLFALMFMDLDGFKPVNDAFGHHVGDQLLRNVAARMRENIHRHDTLARIGGDEFVLLVELGEIDDATTVASRQVALVSKPFTVQDHDLQVTVSIGISLYPGNGRTQQELLMNADAAMYHAKSAGKNGYSFFDASMNTNARNQLQLLQDLRAGVRDRQFCLHYQPKFAADSGKAIGAEALVRWNHPDQGLLMPDKFIGLAEKTGLIIPLGEWVLDEACRQMRVWYDAGYTHWRIAVNLSALQFGHAGLVAAVAHALSTHGLSANCLTLEITETTAMHDADSSMMVLQQLADMGVDLSIDDFGTGYSSLMYLKRLPANELKIDRGFVRDLERDSDDAAIVSAIVALGRALNLRIVAEGVETASQRSFLTQLGCHSLQGYLLGHPLPADRFMTDISAAQKRVSENTL
ncbi:MULTISPECIES: EAL domain-containing protein [unclassified Pseudomonas]|uniref:putative bifunctional diguanylate cyclase/phosphodiesterase n=1 Tax=unclassified Pseudomonas TaxID=196821 RepID=UPI000D39B078|nr:MULTISPECIES: EAL domain-containing protein [unclassified Pseudomonas]RAU40287.1 EAL domain-containing protein [Pseudomonas sp. RIT 409]RAU48966.1 EAL domain-containing protein [Pseudomonas sp. RIT 412]